MIRVAGFMRPNARRSGIYTAAGATSTAADPRPATIEGHIASSDACAAVSAAALVIPVEERPPSAPRAPEL